MGKACIADTVVCWEGATICFGDGAVIMDYCVLGIKNPYDDVFESEEQRVVKIGSKCVIYPWSLLYEGAVIEDEVQIGERSTVGSRTSIGRQSRLVYGAQVHDNVTVGAHSIVGGFVADNCTIGEECHVFGSLVHRYDTADSHAWDKIEEEGPILEREVVVGWGAVVVGRVTIGAGARIRPNAVVTGDVSAGARYG